MTIKQTLSLISGLVLLAGCQLREQREPEPERTEPEPIAVTVDPIPRPARLNQAIDRLEDGEPDQAERLLVAILEDRPAQPVARRLLQQIRQPPEQLLGSDFIEITVQSGDSLSLLAARHAGDSLLFHALARLNGIERPRLLQPGTVLRVPAPNDKPAMAIEAPAETEPFIEPDPEATAIGILESGRVEEGFGLLLSLARAEDLSPEGLQTLVDTAAEKSRQAMTLGQPDLAASWLNRVEPFENQVADPSAHEDQRNRLAALQTLIAANRAGEDGDRWRERELLRRALDLDPDRDDVRQALARVEHELISDYHDRALRAWRDQEVEIAVGLWEKVLEVDADFQPAIIYLERAQEILRRLEAL
jgi:tetratricopeptide (TPR) repeat protein